MISKKIISLLIAFSFFFNGIAFSSDSFNSSRVINDIKELTSQEYKGRLAGDDGNKKATEYIGNFFDKMNLKPLGDNGTYYQSFEVYTPLIKGNCTLGVYDKDNNLIKEYVYGQDFKEVIYGGSKSGTAYGATKHILNPDNYNANENADIIISEHYLIGEGNSSYELDANLAKKGVKAVIMLGERNFKFRSPYKVQKEFNDGLIKIMVKDKIFNEIKSYVNEGSLIKVESPVEITKAKVSNLVGCIEGKNKNLPPLILTAHFDHVGYDVDGTIYPGALDNASGTAMLMECIRVLKENKGLDRTIIFAAFNAEEEFLLGSKFFVENPPMDLTGAECINFDMVGSVKSMPLSLLTLNTRLGFENELRDLLRGNSIKTNTLYQDNSDHVWFCMNNINAVTFIHDDLEKIHSPQDDMTNVDKKRIEEVYSALEVYLIDKGILIETEGKEVTDLFPLKGYIIYMTSILAILLLISQANRLRRNRIK